MTTDKIKADMLALEAAKQAELDAQKQLDTDIIDELTALEPAPVVTEPPPADDPPVVTAPPADDPPPVEDPPVEDPPPRDPVDPVDPPPVVPPAPNLVRVTTTDKAPIHPGTGNTIVLVQNGTVASNWVRKDDPALPGVPVYRNSHGNGQPIYLDGCIAMWVGTQLKAQQVWPETPVPLPDGTLTPPATPSTPSTPSTPTTPTTPATVPTSQVIPSLTMPPAGTSIKAANLSVVITPDDGSDPITLLGSTPTFTYAGGIKVPELGLVMEHSKTVSPDGLWTSSWRSNTDGKRCEIGIMYGDAQSPIKKSFGGFSVKFLAGTFVMNTIHSDAGYWLAEWRAATSDYPDFQTPAQAAAAGWAPKFGRNDVTDTGTIKPATELTGPMSISDVEPYMGQTGGRLDIGYFHGRAAEYYIGLEPAMRRSTRVWSEVSSVGGWHVYDKKTGHAWDFETYPKSCFYSPETGTPPLYVMNKDLTNPLYLEPDDGHHPNLSYPEFCLTLDPWHAKEVMFQALWYLGGEHGDGSPFHAMIQKAYGGSQHSYMVNAGQERGAAWVLRLVACAYLASLRVQDETMPPTSFWKMVLDRNRDILIQYFVNYTTEARTSVFHTMPNQQIFGSWQQDFWNQVMGIMEASAHFPDWQPIFDYCRKNVQDRRDAASGADIEHPFWYYGICGVGTFVPNPSNKGTITFNGPILHNGWVPIGPNTPTERGANAIVFTDATNFTLTTPSKRVSKGVLNVEYGAHEDIGKHTGLNFTITGTPQPSDGGTLQLREMASWKEFDEVMLAQGQFISDWGAQADYIGDDLGAMLIFGQKHPDMAALAQSLIAEMKAKKVKQNPKYSYALAA